MDFLGGLIGAGANLLGGIFNRQSQQDINNQNIMAQNATNQANLNAQREFAQSGVQWRVNDARAAGINPLAALGASTSSFSNLIAPHADASDSLGKGIAAGGQDLGRAIAAMAPVKLRAAELDNQLTEAKIRNLDREFTADSGNTSSIVTKLGQPGTGPGVNVPYPTPDPRGVVIPMLQRARMPDGTIVEIPLEKAASPLQTLAATPTNAMLALRAATGNLGVPVPRLGLPVDDGYISRLPGAVRRATSGAQWAPYFGSQGGF
ncbi:DNA pilot protein [robinz microvirus RP_147]|nr:DNA pilot protein [robinz microvirus RP_147]